MNVRLIDIYIEFLKLGLQLLGGGYVLVPLMKKYLIDGKQWMTEEDLADFYALSQSLPGIIAANISIFAGYKLRGKSGAAAALLGIITTPIISILIIATVLDQLVHLPFMQSVFWGVGISVIILIYLSIKEMWNFSVTDKMSWVIFLGAFIFSFFLNVSPAIVIVLSVAAGVLYKLINEKRETK